MYLMGGGKVTISCGDGTGEVDVKLAKKPTPEGGKSGWHPRLVFLKVGGEDARRGEGGTK